MVEADLPPHMKATFKTLGFHAPPAQPAGRRNEPTPRRPLRIGLIAVLTLSCRGGGAGRDVLRALIRTAEACIVEAVQHATGRDLALNGKIGLKLSLRPTIQARNVAFSNPDGFSRPQMARSTGMELKLGLLPLLSGRSRSSAWC